ncbi:MAG: hypothetical protein JXA90_05585 [Planctomycetes bacterium]|nr:hypothetical protein [Planctomycetota bacterium]
MRIASIRFVLLFAAVGFALPSWAEETDARQAVRREILPLVQRALRPFLTPVPAGRAWLVEASARAEGGEAKGAMLLSWDGEGRLAVRLEIAGFGSIRAAFTQKGDWLLSPAGDVLFTSARRGGEPEGAAPLAASRLREIAAQRLAAALLAAQLAPLPDDVMLEKPEEGVFRVGSRGGDWGVTLRGGRDAGPVRVEMARPREAELRIERVETVDPAELASLLEPPESPSAERREAVEPGALRDMLSTAADMLCEKALWAVQPSAVPSLLDGVPRIDGRAVLVLRGAPEEIGRRYGEALKAAVISNSRRILYGIGLFETLRSGRWFPATLEDVWNRQQKHIPERYRREMDAIADAVGLPREHAYWTNLFPEMFHCSGLAYRGKATAGGRLLHGRILDYMTEVGLQATAVVTVIAPEGRNAWINVGYAGCIGSVTGMNERGLAMGEMGGRGEGHVDGMPMTFLMREILERFETAEEALAWMAATPRTCEYFYVLSDAKTKGMAGVASYAKSLAAERGEDDLQVIRPGMAHPLLPHAMEDVVLMSAGGRYERLAERTRRHYGQITPEIAWEIMGEGVAMRSALHIALFQPETLDLWVAEASLDARPAYTQPIAKLNLRALLERPPELSAR